MITFDLKQKQTRLALGAAVIGLVVLGGAAKQVYFSAPATSRMTALVTTGSIEESVLATGALKPVKLVAVGAQVSGRVIAVNVVRGQKVKKGDLIAQIDSVTQQNNLQTAKAALANVRAQRLEKQATLANARRILARRQQLSALKAVSQTDLEAADTDVRTTQAQIAALEAQISEAQVAVETAQANLGYTRITAPIDGTVLSIVSQEGQTVNAAQSAPTIVILGQLDVMTVRAEISEADVVKVKPGLPVYFTILGAPDQRYETKLAALDPAPESITSDSSFTTSTTSSSSSSSSAIYYIGTFNMPNPDGRLRTYMTAQVHIVLGQAKNVLTIPSAALSRAADGRYSVQVVGSDQKLSTRTVVVGLNNKISAEIRSGLSLGERVVTGEASTTTVKSAGGGGPPPMF